MKNSADQGRNTLRDLQNSLYRPDILRKPNSIIALLFIQNIFKLLKEK